MNEVANKIIEIENRLNGITSGKWVYEEVEDECDDHIISTEEGKYIAQTTYDTLSSSMNHNVVEDSIFIASAPDDIRFLLDLVKTMMN